MGVADPSSEAAVPGLVDQAQFARAQQAIVSACESLLNPASTQEQVYDVVNMRMTLNYLYNIGFSSCYCYC